MNEGPVVLSKNGVQKRGARHAVDCHEKQLAAFCSFLNYSYLPYPIFTCFSSQMTIVPRSLEGSLSPMLIVDTSASFFRVLFWRAQKMSCVRAFGIYRWRLYSCIREFFPLFFFLFSLLLFLFLPFFSPFFPPLFPPTNMKNLPQPQQKSSECDGQNR